MANDNDKKLDEIVKLLRALVILQLEGLTKIDEDAKPEILLARAGLSAPEAARLLAKKEATVRKSVERARKRK